MKWLLSSFGAILIACSSAMAQNNHPLVEEGKVWYYEASNPNVDPDYYKVWEDVYSLEGDTVIGSHKCLKLYLTSNSPYISHDHSYIGAMYEESERVYYIAPDNTTSVIIYDFSCNVGEIFKINLYNIYNPKIVKWGEYDLIINDKQLVKYRDEYVTVMNLSPFFDDEVIDICTIWIEGVGSELSLLNSTPVWNTGGICTELIMCKLNDQIIFDTSEFYKSAEIVTGIVLPSDEEIVNGKSSNGKWFDLQGRRLSGKPARGIYIEDGKKVLLK